MWYVPQDPFQEMVLTLYLGLRFLRFGRDYSMHPTHDVVMSLAILNKTAVPIYCKGLIPCLCILQEDSLRNTTVPGMV